MFRPSIWFVALSLACFVTTAHATPSWKIRVTPQRQLQAWLDRVHSPEERAKLIAQVQEERVAYDSARQHEFDLYNRIKTPADLAPNGFVKKEDRAVLVWGSSFASKNYYGSGKAERWENGEGYEFWVHGGEIKDYRSGAVFPRKGGDANSVVAAPRP
jgi:hypothetical protein